MRRTCVFSRNAGSFNSPDSLFPCCHCALNNRSFTSTASFTQDYISLSSNQPRSPQKGRVRETITRFHSRQLIEKILVLTTHLPLTRLVTCYCRGTNHLRVRCHPARDQILQQARKYGTSQFIPCTAAGQAPCRRLRERKQHGSHFNTKRNIYRPNVREYNGNSLLSMPSPHLYKMTTSTKMMIARQRHG